MITFWHSSCTLFFSSQCSSVATSIDVGMQVYQQNTNIVGVTYGVNEMKNATDLQSIEVKLKSTCSERSDCKHVSDTVCHCVSLCVTV